MFYVIYNLIYGKENIDLKNRQAVFEKCPKIEDMESDGII